jgi:hypothetical protein
MHTCFPYFFCKKHFNLSLSHECIGLRGMLCRLKKESSVQLFRSIFFVLSLWEKFSSDTNSGVQEKDRQHLYFWHLWKRETEIAHICLTATFPDALVQISLERRQSLGYGCVCGGELSCSRPGLIACKNLKKPQSHLFLQFACTHRVRFCSEVPGTAEYWPGPRVLDRNRSAHKASTPILALGYRALCLLSCGLASLPRCAWVPRHAKHNPTGNGGVSPRITHQCTHTASFHPWLPRDNEPALSLPLALFFSLSVCVSPDLNRTSVSTQSHSE